MNDFMRRLSIVLVATFQLSACAQTLSSLDMEAAPSDYDRRVATGAAVAPATSASRGETGEISAFAEDASAVEVETQSAQVHRGTGVFIKSNVAHVSPIQVTPEGDITLNFADADIREVARTILGEILKVNFVIDPAVQGTITVQTSRPLPREALLPTLETTLRLNGAAVVRNGDLYKIVPMANAARESAPLRAGIKRAGAEGFGIQIVPLQHVAAGEMEKILAPMVADGGILRIDEARNLLVLAGTRQQIWTLLDAVEIFDVDWLAGMSFGLFPIQFADATTIIEELKTVFDGDGESPLAGMIRFVPIERLNAVLAFSPRPDYLTEVETWIARLDQSVDKTSRRIFVYYVQNGDAVNLAAVLTEIFAPEGAGDLPKEDLLAPGLEPVVLRTPEVAAEDAAPAEAATEGATTAAARQYRQRTQPAVGGEGLALAEGGAVRIIADEANNAIVILATPQDFKLIEAALKKLDIVPLQVLIEATIAEVTLNDELKYGVQWFFADGNHSFTLSDVASGAISSSFPGFSHVFAGSANTRVVLNALASVTDVEVISSPQLMVLDNQTASLQVGDQVPVATQQSVGTADANAPIVNTIQFRDTGVILRVTPRVNASGLVRMEIEQEVSDVASTTTSGIDSPTIQQRKIASSVAIQSGETVALGGLIRDTKTDTQSGIPFISKIPILGALFRSTTDNLRRTELLILITPRVIGNLRQAREITDELRQRMRAVIPLHEKIE